MGSLKVCTCLNLKMVKNLDAKIMPILFCQWTRDYFVKVLPQELHFVEFHLAVEIGNCILKFVSRRILRLRKKIVAYVSF